MLLLLFSYYIPMSIQRVKYSYFSNPSQISKLFSVGELIKTTQITSIDLIDVICVPNNTFTSLSSDD